VRQLVIGAGLYRFDSGSRIEVIELGSGEGFAVGGVHGWIR
ncbi:MAG: hypothetical protein RI928_1271, partial [Pseudomonadota bacterium]